jgi:tetratricopeptide (TPR) repeat protein
LKKFILLTLIIISISAGNSYPQNAQDRINSGIKNNDLNAEQIFEENKSALISIWMHINNNYSYTTNTYNDTTVLNGSGFIFDETGLIGTNYHVVEGIDSLLVKTSDGTFFNADLVFVDRENDFAIIKLINDTERKFPVVKFGNSDNIKTGQEVYAIGSPLGYEYTISSGIVAAVRDNEKVSFSDPVTYESKEKTFEKVIQITAAISPGNSGGALFNSKGEVIGITTYTFIGYGNLNFAVAINTFNRLIKLAESKNFENNEEFKSKKEESIFNTNYKIASDLKSQLSNDWYYSKQKDTLKNPDEFLEKLDSVNRVNFDKAEKYYQKCLEIKPDTFIIYQDLMDLYVLTDNFQKAEDLYRAIRIKFESDSLQNLLSSNLASAYTTSKEYDKAIQFYEKMLKQDETQYFIYYQIAGIYAEKNDYKSAVTQYKKLLALDSNYNEANVQLGKIYFTKYKNTEKSKRYLQKAYENELLNTGGTPYNIDLLYYMGLIAVEEGRKLDAIMAYMDLKSVYGYNAGDSEKKLNLYKEILNMDE